MSDVRISIDARLDKIESSLGDLNKLLVNVGKTAEGTGKKIESSFEEGFNGANKQTENFMARLGGLGKKTLKALGDDFKTLFSLNALKESLKISDKVRDRVVQIATLNDAIRKMGSSFGIASKDFRMFQFNLQGGLSDVGVSAEAAANALEGLMGTQVKGEKDVIRFAKQAGMIAALSGETGQESVIAKGMADVALKGFSPEQIGTTLARMQQGAGMKGSESIGLMRDVLTNMTPDQITQMGGMKGIEDLAMITKTSGQESLGFLKQLVQSMSPLRSVMESQGAGDVFTDKGFNASAFKKFVDELKRRHTDPKFALTTAGMSEENATAFLKLADSLDTIKKETDELNSSFKSTEDTLVKQRGLAESFSTAFNKVMGSLLPNFITSLSQPLTKGFAAMSESTAGSYAMVGGGAVLAAMLAGGGLRGIGKGMGIPGMLGGVAKGKALEQAGVQPVYVVNANEIGGGMGGAAGMLGGVGKMGLLGKAGLIGTAAMIASPIMKELADEYTMKQTTEGIGEANIVDRALLKLMRMTGIGLDEQTLSNLTRSEAMVKSGEIKVVMADPRLKEVHTPTRGGSFE